MFNFVTHTYIFLTYVAESLKFFVLGAGRECA